MIGQKRGKELLQNKKRQCFLVKRTILTVQSNKLWHVKHQLVQTQYKAKYWMVKPLTILFWEICGRMFFQTDCGFSWPKNEDLYKFLNSRFKLIFWIPKNLFLMSIGIIWSVLIFSIEVEQNCMITEKMRKIEITKASAENPSGGNWGAL